MRAETLVAQRPALTTTRRIRAMAEDRISLPDEIWKPVVGFEGTYEVSNFGRLWSVPRKHPRSGRFLRYWVTPKGYRKFKIGGVVSVTRYIHALVLEAFVGPRPEGMEAAHLNGDPSDNRVENLKWVSSEENKLHQKQHGTQPLGSSHHTAKLTEENVQDIRRLRRGGMLWKEIAQRFGVSKNTARSAGYGLTGFSKDGAISLNERRWHH